MQDLRKRLDAERNQKEQFMQQLQAVKEEVTAAADSAQKDAAAAQKQVSPVHAWLACHNHDVNQSGICQGFSAV